jgi:hypothetical protein
MSIRELVDISVIGTLAASLVALNLYNRRHSKTETATFSRLRQVLSTPTCPGCGATPGTTANCDECYEFYSKSTR